MKKTLLFLLIITGVSFGYSQILQQENFNTLTIGNVGTDITGTTPGQGSWLTISNNGTTPTTSTNASAANFQIVNTGNNSTNGLSIAGPNGDKGARFMWKDGLDELWLDRIAGNNRIEVEYDFFTGTNTTAQNDFAVILYNAAFTPIVGINYRSDTRVLTGRARLSQNSVEGNFNINFAAAPGLVLTENTWIRLAFGYNTTTGQPYWRFTGLTGSTTINQSASIAWVPNLVPFEVDFVSVSSATTNTLSTSRVFDNLIVTATSADTLLSVEEVVSIENAVSIYPNPIENSFQIQTNGFVVNSANIFDINGRKIKSFQNTSNFDISELPSGIYFVEISNDEMKTTQKIIKK